eukprot:COSAG02_NODE_66419_length_255_cov_0.974359_1_plen_27_part_10
MARHPQAMAALYPCLCVAKEYRNGVFS